MRLGQSSNFAKAGDAVGHDDVALQNIDDVPFQHPAEFMHAPIVFSADDPNADQAIQLGQFIEDVAQPRFFARGIQPLPSRL